MANTITTGNKVITLSAIDSDWTAGGAIVIKSITLVPGAANDVVVIKDSTDAGPVICQLTCPDIGDKTQHFDKRMKPCLDFSASTLSSGAVVIIHL